ncbi:benomyl methotrexate resistance [Fusarium denticulatum]|uniref:Benomyl methotrexate resistance n=1 Tax=Fusarium denticulatum TaxID=48507 RepID=A0A8H5X7I6_9HYPO|nr:benomyl methotrexate resistance [Fusarium denticulatum]
MSFLKRALAALTLQPYNPVSLKVETQPFISSNGFVDFAPDDIENPRNWSMGRRVLITIATVFLDMVGTFSSSAPTGCLPSIANHFGVSLEVAGLTLTLFVLGYCAGPLAFAPLSEIYGRQHIFTITFTLYLASSFLCAFAPNLPSLLIGRMLAGIFVSAPLSNGPAVIADIWSPIEMAVAMAGFGAVTFLGPALGPITAGFLDLAKGWEWSFYSLLWLAIAGFLVSFTIPETHAPTLLRHKAERIRAQIPNYKMAQAECETQDRSLKNVFQISLTRPWVILFDPISFCIAIYVSVVYTLLYMLFSIYPIVFQERRGWNAGVGALPLLGTSIGACLGGVFVLFDTMRQMKRAEKGKEIVAEHRLPVSIVGGIGFAVSMFWFAWTAEFDSIHWIVPTLAGVGLACSNLLLFVGFLNYLVDTYLAYAASAMAANTILRSACAATAPLFTTKMFHTLGVGGGGSVIGGMATLLAAIPFLFWKYGKNIRIRSKFAAASAHAADPLPSSIEMDQAREEDLRLH